MKNDPTFKVAAIVILTGVAIALFSPTAPNADSTGTQVVATTTRTATFAQTSIPTP